MTATNRVRVVTIATSVALLAAAIAVFVAARSMPPRVCELADEPVRLPEPAPAPAMSVAQSMPITAPPPAPPADVALLFTAGEHTYVDLDVPLLDLPRHGTPRLVEDAHATVAIADVATRDVPADLRDWKRAGVSVDGSCTARVTGFAVVSRLRGLPRDASEDLEEWTPSSVLEHGRQHLAARIEGCAGTVARKATRPVIEVFTEGDGSLADPAREQTLASSLVADVQREWQDAGNDGSWYEADDARVDSRVFVHPRTGVAWAVVHVYRYDDCGQLGGNVLGLFRIAADGTLATVQLRRGGHERVDQLIDLDGDGEPELVGASGSEAWIEHANGESITWLEVRLLGCGC